MPPEWFISCYRLGAAIQGLLDDLLNYLASEDAPEGMPLRGLRDDSWSQVTTLSLIRKPRTKPYSGVYYPTPVAFRSGRPNVGLHRRGCRLPSGFALQRLEAVPRLPEGPGREL